MIFSSIPESYVPCKIDSYCLDIPYRHVSLSHKLKTMPANFDIEFRRCRHKIVVQSYFGIATNGGNTLEFTSWQKAHNFIEESLIELTKDGLFKIVSDDKYPFYHDDPFIRGFRYLNEVARHEQVISYLEFEIMAGVHRNAEAGALLGRLAEHSYLTEKIILPSIVVSSAHGMPGIGLFKLLQDMGITPNLGDKSIYYSSIWKQLVSDVWKAR